MAQHWGGCKQQLVAATTLRKVKVRRGPLAAHFPDNISPVKWMLLLPLPLLLSQAHQILIMLMFYIFLWINKFACVQQRRQEVHQRGGKGNRGATRSHTSWEIKALLIIFNRLYTYMESACLPALVPRCARGRECNKLATCPTQLAARCMRSKLYAALIKITALLRYYLSHSLSACVCVYFQLY